MNPHAQPYAFPAGGNRALAEYLTQTTQYDPATACLEWLGKFDRDGIAIAAGPVTKQHGTRQATRLAWMAHRGRKLDKATQLVRSCGNPRCVNPHHLREADANDQWNDPEMPRKRQGSVGALRLGKRLIDAKRVYQIQSLPPPRDPSLGLRWAFRWDITLLGSHGLPLTYAQRERLEVIRAIRRCPIRASRTVLPCGFIRYDLPPGVTEIAFTEPPPPSYEDVFGLPDDDDCPEADCDKVALALAA